ncbi:MULTISPECIES: type II secretion system F family protein [unclassified Fusibacter]|uniref:type II secretion system F family protein n=1 Tax=unclassified Fusibacter TaxID=2624464 RepID=UPI001FAA1EA5|nr:type II secretion system F family protein [Fusibacter sp. A1]MCK8058905.1 type II secretion system F family protein [Fusibacter sp. A2]
MTSLYICKEIDTHGKMLTSTYKAESKDDVIQMIRAKGHKPVKIEEEQAKSKDLAELSIFQPKVKAKDIAVFCKQLHIMLYAGMPLISALDVLESQSDNLTLKKAVKQMALDVQKGEILSSTMKKHTNAFPALLINMVESGELTGNLDSVLMRMSDHFTKENKIQTKIKGALVYPAILSVLAVVVVTFLLVFIMPTFVGMFESSGVPLPTPTLILMGISSALKTYWYLFIAGAAGLYYLGRAILKSKEGKRAVDKLKFKIPIVNSSVAKIATSRFTRTLSTLLASGIPIIQALESSASVTGNMVVIEGLAQVAEDIKKGEKLSSLLKKVGIFPPMVISMVGIGEESGALEEMLEKTADYFDEELEAAIQRLVTMIEPLMIVVMALIIGFIVISMMLPMFDMMQTVQ